MRAASRSGRRPSSRTRCPTAMSSRLSAGPPSASSRQLSATVRTRLDAERRGDVAGDGVGVDQQDRLALAGLECRGEVRGDGRLADAALRVEDRDRRGPRVPAGRATSPPWRTGPLPSSTVVAPDAHRLDAPADRVGRVGASEVFVVASRPGASRRAARSARGETTVRAGIGRACVLEDDLERDGPVDIDLAVEDRQPDVAPILERLLELARLGRPG